jgi:hypothetical protein
MDEYRSALRMKGELLVMAPGFMSPGGTPVNTDAKYRIKHGADGAWQIEVVYYIDDEIFYRPATREHPELIDLVHAAKGYDGGTFVINEWSQVVVRREDGRVVCAGEYDQLLEFDVAGATVSAEPSRELEPGDLWLGPRIGRAYVLNAGGEDVSYTQTFSDGAFRKQRLSKEVGVTAAKALATRLAVVKGARGGVIYINERRHFFAPGPSPKETLYLGALGEDAWFPKPECC